MKTTIEITTISGDRILIPFNNIEYVNEGDRGTNYIKLKTSIHPVETTKRLESIKAEMNECTI